MLKFLKKLIVEISKLIVNLLDDISRTIEKIISTDE